MTKLIINGREAAIDAQHYASFHGSSIFSTLRSHQKKPLLWPAHWQRLSEHATFFGYKMPHEEQILQQISEVLQENAPDQKIRVIIEANRYALSFEPYEPPCSSVYEGATVRISKRALHPELKKFKTGNSWPYQKALAEAKEEGVFESLLLDSSGYIVDGSRTSVMYFDGLALHSLEGGLPGIMREEALALAQKHRCPILRSYLKPGQLVEGQLMLANCLMGVVPVGAARYAIVSKLVEHFRMED